MRLDIRIPIGLLFAILGGLLVFYGVIGDGGSLGINVNLGGG